MLLGRKSYVHIFSTNTFTYLWNWNWDSWISWCPFSNVWFFNFAFDEGANTRIGCRAATGAMFHFWLGSNWRWAALNLMRGNNSRLPPLGLRPMAPGDTRCGQPTLFCFILPWFCNNFFLHRTTIRHNLPCNIFKMKIGFRWHCLEFDGSAIDRTNSAGNFCHVSFQLAR